MTRSHMAIIGLAFLMLAPNLNGQIPKKITYQGVVRDDNGVLFPDGPINLLFRIYDAATAGNLHHEEFHSTTNITIPDTVKNGTFTAVLGPQAVAPYANLDLLSPSVPLWLEIAIWDGFTWDIQLPRTAFTTVLYAAAVGEVTRADTAGIVVGDNIFPSTGNVGIGTNNPSVELEVVGGIKMAAQTRYYTIPGFEFKNRSGGQLSIDSTEYYVFTSDNFNLTYAVAPVHLPQDATITGVRLSYWDDEGSGLDSSNFTIHLLEMVPGAPPNTITTFEAPNGGAFASTHDSGALSYAVDNTSKAYMVRAVWKPTSYSAKKKLRLFNILITYTVTEPLP